MRRIAIFIDAGYLNSVVKKFGDPRIDMKKLSSKMSQNIDVMRTFFYDCPPYVSKTNPTSEELERLERKNRFVYSVERLPRFQVRQGRLEYKGPDSNGFPLFIQKRVDLMLGIDLVLFSAKHRITDAAIFAGDSDFLPAIEVAKAEGVVLHLFYGESAHRDLVHVCDERTLITQMFVDEVTLRNGY